MVNHYDQGYGTVMVKTETTSSQEIRQRIESLLDALPLESLTTIEQLLYMIHQPASTARKQRYPTIAAPASTLTIWTQLLPEGYEGNALEDTEALYDEV